MYGNPRPRPRVIRDLKEPKHAIWAWFNGQHVWNPDHRRYEGRSGAVGLLWFWLDFETARVMVISCFDAKDEEQETP